MYKEIELWAMKQFDPNYKEQELIFSNNIPNIKKGILK